MDHTGLLEDTQSLATSEPLLHEFVAMPGIICMLGADRRLLTVAVCSVTYTPTAKCSCLGWKQTAVEFVL